jgi:hypothetical protein
VVPSTSQELNTCKVGNSLPSGEKETRSVWPLSVWSGAPVVASQSRTVRSYEPETTCLPSEEKATEEIRDVWSLSV